MSGFGEKGWHVSKKNKEPTVGPAQTWKWWERKKQLEFRGGDQGKGRMGDRQKTFGKRRGVNKRKKKRGGWQADDPLLRTGQILAGNKEGKGNLRKKKRCES